MIDQTFRSGQ